MQVNSSMDKVASEKRDLNKKLGHLKIKHNELVKTEETIAKNLKEADKLTEEKERLTNILPRLVQRDLAGEPSTGSNN